MMDETRSQRKRRNRVGLSRKQLPSSTRIGSPQPEFQFCSRSRNSTEQHHSSGRGAPYLISYLIIVFFFSPTKSRQGARPRQLASRRTRARRPSPSRAPSCPRAVALRDRVLCTPGAPADHRAALAILDHHRYLRRPQSQRGGGERHSVRGGRRASGGGRGRRTCCTLRRPFCEEHWPEEKRVKHVGVRA